jgi:hypothetical protein
MSDTYLPSPSTKKKIPKRKMLAAGHHSAVDRQTQSLKKRKKRVRIGDDFIRFIPSWTEKQEKYHSVKSATTYHIKRQKTEQDDPDEPESIDNSVGSSSSNYLQSGPEDRQTTMFGVPSRIIRHRSIHDQICSEIIGNKISDRISDYIASDIGPNISDPTHIPYRLAPLRSNRVTIHDEDPNRTPPYPDDYI